jgi:hypothetical protein
MPIEFFTALGGLAGSVENQLSTTFSVCFAKSAFFRRTIIALLVRTCGIRDLSSGEWTCRAQVPTPWPGGGLVDLRIVPSVERRRQRASQRAFYLESKVEAPLTCEQLKRYRKHGISYLVAITKYPPECTVSELAEIGAFAVRWQDVHRELEQGNPSSPVERFIVREFVSYLEDLGMAHREDITLQDLTRVKKVLSTAACARGGSTGGPDGSPGRDLIPRNGFEVADSCLNILQDLRRQFVEQRPTFASYRRWGPGYFVWFEDGGARWHAFGWELFKSDYPKASFGCRFWFPDRQSDTPRWAVHLEGTAVSAKEWDYPIKQMMTRGTLDQAKLLASVTHAARAWRLK